MAAEKPMPPFHTSRRGPGVPHPTPSAGSPHAPTAATTYPVTPRPERDPHARPEPWRRPEDAPPEPSLADERLALSLAPPCFTPPAPVAPAAAAAPPVAASALAGAAGRASLEDLFGAGVRRVAWAGDARRGTARVEMGEGLLEGAVVMVHAEGSRVSIEVSGADGARTSAWAERVRARLAQKGVDVEEIRFV